MLKMLLLRRRFRSPTISKPTNFFRYSFLKEFHLTQIYNFSAGPAVLPESVLLKVKEEMLDWNGSGMSVMEMSHRGPEFMSIAEGAEASLRRLMGISQDYSVLFLQGGATLQFSQLLLNLVPDDGSVDYVYTGEWSKKAIAEARGLRNVNVVASSESESFARIPDFASWNMSSDASYLHITSNETIGGLEFQTFPINLSSPLVADMSSNILSRPVRVDDFGVIYAGAQKNIGPAGLTIVIIRRDLLERSPDSLPSMLSYAIQDKNQSMLNTPPTFAMYVSGLVFDWLNDLGGLSVIEKTNIEKSNLLYEKIDSTDFYVSPIRKEDRSRMNVPFRISESGLEKEFLKKADERGLLQLKGHRSVGGIRASIYNAMPINGVRTLVDFMSEFERENG